MTDGQEDDHAGQGFAPARGRVPPGLHLVSTPIGAARDITLRGLDLLVHQAALQFEQFTELPAPLLEMRQAGEAALRERLDEGT